MPEPIKPIRVRMKVPEADGLNAPLVAVMPSDRTYKTIVHASKQLSPTELHAVRNNVTVFGSPMVILPATRVTSLLRPLAAHRPYALR